MQQLIIRRPSNAAEMEGLRALRIEVFVREQGVPEELELDALDAEAIHAVAWDGREVVGTGRLLLRHSEEARIGRMAVRSSLRGRGIGGAILEFLEKEAKAQGAQRLELHAQSYVQSFYRRHGYRQEGTQFTEAGIEHVLMHKRLS